MHPTEDRLFHFSVEEFGVSLYGVVDGFGGAGVADFSAKKMPAELLLGQVRIVNYRHRRLVLTVVLISL
jgi:hypothetical protein